MIKFKTVAVYNDKAQRINEAEDEMVLFSVLHSFNSQK